ncbi:Wzz/FepE/Etk N-terminal domain-containing protein [Modestobacter sp. SYSU DS0511]
MTTLRDQAHPGHGSVVASALWRGRWLIGGAAVVAGVLGAQLSALQDETYTAESRMVLSATANFNPLGGNQASNAGRYLANQMAILDSEPVLELVAEQLGGDADPAELAEAVNVATLADSDIVVISATAPDPEQAAARADAVAAAYQQYVTQRVQEIADAAAAAVAADPAAVADVRTQAAVYGDGVAVAEPAAVPTAPTAPNPIRDGALLAVLAALVAAGVAILRRGRGPVSGVQLADEAEAPLLGEVDLALSRSGRLEPDAEAFGMPLVALDYATDGRTGSVLVTELDERELGAGVALGLAASAALTRRVLVVDADGAGHRLTRMTGVPRPPRPLDDLVGGVPVEEVTTRWPATAGDQVVDIARLGTSALRNHGGVTVLHRCLEQVAGDYDLVLFTAGPIFSDPVAFALLREVASVVLVVDRRGGKRLAPTLASFRYRLQLADRSCDGVIVARQHRSRGAGASAAPAEPAPPARRTDAAPEAAPVAQR